MGLLKSCLLCSLKTGCFLVAFYTFALAAILLVFNVHDLVFAPDFIAWSRIVSFVFSVLLFFAGLCLLIGLFRNSIQMLGVWIAIFVLFVLYQIAMISWNLYYFGNKDQPMPEDLYGWQLANIIAFGILIFGDVLAVVAVHSYREYIGGKGLVPVPTMA